MNFFRGLLIALPLSALLWIALIWAAFAQQSANEQALGQKLMAEISSGLQCSAQTISLRAELEKALAEMKRLSDKYESTPAKN